MASNYPTGLDTFSTSHTDGIGEIIHAATVNDLADAANEIEAELGISPSGPTYTTVAARLDALERPLATVVSGTTYTFALADASDVIEFTSASAVTVTIPPNASVAFVIGTLIEILQYGAGQVTVAAGAGVTLRSPGGKTKTSAQYASALLRKRGTNEWMLEGDIST